MEDKRLEDDSDDIFKEQVKPPIKRVRKEKAKLDSAVTSLENLTSQSAIPITSKKPSFDQLIGLQSAQGFWLATSLKDLQQFFGKPLPNHLSG